MIVVCDMGPLHSQKLDHLVRKTRFYVGKECKQVIQSMTQRDLQQKLAREPTDQKQEPYTPSGEGD
ncbi:MAG: hypothetical protein ACHRXM_10310 [Isosphaerales bacterium]